MIANLNDAMAEICRLQAENDMLRLGSITRGALIKVLRKDNQELTDLLKSAMSWGAAMKAPGWYKRAQVALDVKTGA